MLSRALQYRLAGKARPLCSQSVYFISSSHKVKNIEKKRVPVTSYTEKSQKSPDDAQRTTLHVNQKRQASLETKDVARKAVPFDKSLLSKLTPTMKSFTLDGKVALVTGGARGLGWNISQALAEAGASAIALLDIKQDLGDSSAASLHQSTGIPVQFYKVDVRDAATVADTMSRIVHDLGSIDIVINSAGVVDSNIKAETYDADKFRTLLDINLTGSFLVSQAAARQMMMISPSPLQDQDQDQEKEKPPQPPQGGGGGGSIIFLSSIAGSRVLHPQQQCAYNASKAAVSQLARSLAAEWAPHGIRVNTIAPGYMDTTLNREALLDGQKGHWCAMTPMGRLGLPGELNGLAVFLASDAAGFVTGAEVLCDGGYACY